MSKVNYPPESVYNWIPKKEDDTEKAPRYVSKFRPAVLLENKSSKDAMRTMGPAKEEMPSPDKYLKKHSKEPKLPDKTQHSKDASFAVKKPPVPARTDNLPMANHAKGDFAKTAVAVPRKPQPTSVDSHKGHKQLLENSGLVPKYIMKKEYGQVPEYLRQRIEEQRRGQEELNNSVKEQQEQGTMKCLSDEERQTVLEGLKKNWDELHREYQGLPLVIYTLARKVQKEQLEKEMKQLEKDIKLFERFKTIYVPNNN